MASKMTKEAMIKFIEENKEVYNGKMSLDNLQELDDAALQKLYRNVKTKCWSLGRKTEAKSSILAQVAKCTSTEQLDTLRAELERAIEAIDEARVKLKEAAKLQLQSQIEELQQQLENLK